MILQTKIVQVIERMEKYGYSINDDIERKKKFRNPSIYEKLIEAYGIDEYGSNFPTVILGLPESIMNSSSSFLNSNFLFQVC